MEETIYERAHLLTYRGTTHLSKGSSMGRHIYERTHLWKESSMTLHIYGGFIYGEGLFIEAFMYEISMGNLIYTRVH